MLTKKISTFSFSNNYPNKKTYELIFLQICFISTKFVKGIERFVVRCSEIDMDLKRKPFPVLSHAL